MGLSCAFLPAAFAALHGSVGSHSCSSDSLSTGLQPFASLQGLGCGHHGLPKLSIPHPSAHARLHCIASVPFPCRWGARTPGFLMKLRVSLGGIRWLLTLESLQRTGQGRLARGCRTLRSPSQGWTRGEHLRGLSGSRSAGAAGVWAPGPLGQGAGTQGALTATPSLL